MGKAISFYSNTEVKNDRLFSRANLVPKSWLVNCFHGKHLTIFWHFKYCKGPQKVMLRTQSKNNRNFHFVTTLRHLEEGPVLRSHKFDRSEQQKLWNLMLSKRKWSCRSIEIVFLIEGLHPGTCKMLLVLCFC